MLSLGAALLQYRADLVRAALAEILELMADDESHEVGEPEAGEDLCGSVASPGRLSEGGIELRATDFDSGGAVLGEKPVEPMLGAIEVAAEVKQQCIYGRHESPQSSSRDGRPPRDSLETTRTHCDATVQTQVLQ